MQLRTEVEILASPARVWEVLTDVASYSDWNPFIKSLEGKLAVGERLRVTFTPLEGSEHTFKPVVTAVEPARELRWRGKLWFGGLFDGEHFFLLSEVDPNRTRLIQGEDFSGILVKYMGPTLTRTARGFVGMNQALKRRVENDKRA
jgi:hypothetical protein